MEVRQAIDDLRWSLARVSAEDELLGVITDRLTFLRRSFPFHRSHFTAGDIGFLKSVGAISDSLRAFCELKEELPGVDSVEEYQDVIGRLTHARNALAFFPVVRRIAMEMRALHERLPAIREQDATRRRFRLSGRILEMERRAPSCHRNHPMVIREGARGRFWGCSRYPFCCATRQLATEEEAFLGA